MHCQECARSDYPRARSDYPHPLYQQVSSNYVQAWRDHLNVWSRREECHAIPEGYLKIIYDFEEAYWSSCLLAVDTVADEGSFATFS